MAAAQAGISYFSACTLDRNAIQLADNGLACRAVSSVVLSLAFFIIATDSNNFAA